MKIAVTGATGQLGRLVVDALLKHGIPADQVIAAVRSPEKAADLAALGVQVREADYNRPDTLAAAFQGVEKVLLISGNDPVRRLDQHRAVVDAAKRADVRLLAYTSGIHADTSPAALVPDHKVTEEYISASGLPYSFLRNGAYTENYLPSVQQALTTGVLARATGDGHIASAARADFAAAAAVVLTGEGQENTIHELTGDTAWTMADLAAVITELTGTKVVYQAISAEQYAQALQGAGLPAPLASLFAQADADVAAGLSAEITDDLIRLIGRPTAPLRVTLANALTN